MKLRWRARASRDLAAIVDHILADNPQVAAAVYRRTVDRVRQIERHPDIGRPGRIAGTREPAVTGTPRIVHYRGAAGESAAAAFANLGGGRVTARRRRAARSTPLAAGGSAGRMTAGRGSPYLRIRSVGLRRHTEVCYAAAVVLRRGAAASGREERSGAARRWPRERPYNYVCL